MSNYDKYNKKFINFVEELLSESEGQRIVHERGLFGLEQLFTECTNKSPLKKKRKK